MMEALDELRRIAERWVGTPFRMNCAVLGRGVDCKLLVASILAEHLRTEVALQDFMQIDAPFIDDGRGRRSFEMAFGRWYLQIPLPTVLLAQDVVLYRQSRGTHVGLMISDYEMVHAVYGRQVIIERLDQSWGPEIRAVYRRRDAEQGGGICW